MAAIGTAASDIAYTPVAGGARLNGPGRTVRQVRVIFPTGATNNQYPTGGVPLTVPSLGFPRGVVTAIRVTGTSPTATASMNPVWQWNGDPVAPKLVALAESAAGTGGTAFDQWPNNTVVGTITQTLFLDVEGG